MSSSSLRYLLYSHDTYGLGHFRRAALIAGGIVAASPTAQVLIATGSPRAQAFSLPERVDSLKLPAVTKDGAGCYQPRKIMSDLDELVELRSSLLAAACATFRPDVIVVDQAPTGMAGELIPMLQMIDNLAVRPRLVLGLRDIVDDAASVAEQWRRHREWEWLERYDDIAVYGDPQILTTADELSLASRLPARVTHTGYVAPNMPEASPCEPFILVTPGGGGDGQALIRKYLDAVDVVSGAGIKSLIVTGPLMSASRRAELVLRTQERPEVEVIEFSDNMRQLVASSIGCGLDGRLQHRRRAARVRHTVDAGPSHRTETRTGHSGSTSRAAHQSRTVPGRTVLRYAARSVRGTSPQRAHSFAARSWWCRSGLGAADQRAHVGKGADQCMKISTSGMSSSSTRDCPKRSS